MTLKLTYAGFNYVADVDGSYADADSLASLQSETASNSVALTDDYAINAATNTVYGDYSTDTTTGITETIPDLTATIKEAEGKGLSVLVRPLIDFSYNASPAMLKTSAGNQYSDGDWRATYQPTNIPAFLASYDTMIVAEAKAAQAGGAQLFDIGTELDQLTGPSYLSEWTKIINDVKAVYTGKLTYSAISDDDLSPWTYGGPPAGTGDITTQVSFWSQLDYVGIDEYAAISDAQNAGANPDPTYAQLLAAWESTPPPDSVTAQTTGGKSLIAYYEGISAALNKPLLFTEIGYNSAPDAASQPFYTSSNTYDPTLQANLYKAFLQAWADQGNTSLQGVYFWNWEPDPGTVGAGQGPNWTPQGNTGALQVVDAAYTAATANTPSPGTTNPDVYTWTTTNGDWGTAANWDDVTTGANPATIAPGAKNIVTITGGASAASTITGLGNAAALTVLQDVTLDGTFSVGMLAIGSAATAATFTDVIPTPTMLAPITSLATNATIVNGTWSETNQTISITGTLVLGGAAATNSDDSQTLSLVYSDLSVGGLVLGKTSNYYVNNYVSVDANSALVVGAANSVGTVGNLTINAGYTMSGTGTVAANIVNQGTLLVQGGLLYVTGWINTTGSTQIGAGATLEVLGTTNGVSFAGAAGTLIVQPSSAAGSTFPITGPISGFASGDEIDIGGTTVTRTVYASTGASAGTLTLYNGATQLGSVSLSGNYTGDRFTLTADAAGTGTDIGVAAGAIAPSDFNGDGKSDLVLHNDNGALAIDVSNGLGAATTVALGNPGPSWHVVGTGDFNGDGKADILLQNDDGTVVDYLMNGTTITSGGVLGSPGSAWHVRGVGDFNGDGKSDILLQNDNGSMVDWTVSGSTVTGGTSLGTLPAGWTVEGVADFNGDGHPDILAQKTDGTLVEYTVVNGAITTGGIVGNPGAGWEVAGTGDYNGDGKADILLHYDGGQDVIYEMNGSSIIGSTYIGNPGAAYTGNVAGVDINGDGSSDLVVQNNATSTLVGYTFNSAATITAGAVLGTPGAGWNAVGNAPAFLQDGSMAGTQTGTAGADQFNLTTPGTGLHQIAGFDTAVDTVALSISQFANYAAVQAAEQPYQGGTFIDFTPNSALVIQGITPSQLTAANFVLR